MFATTFLGHQGWLFQTKRACILVDPLLCEDFGHTQALQYRVFPPRVLAPEKIPALDAVVLTHEHDDHFDIPSLAKLDRAIPIYLSARSSIAARQILATMGFSVHPLEPGVAIKWKDLELIPFAGDHLTVNCGDEWDALPFLVRQTGGSGSFFSMVDITLTQGHVERARGYLQEPGLVSWTNNALDWHHMTDYMSARQDATQDCFVKMGVGHKLISTVWGAPSAMLFCAGGFAFHGDRAWMNERIFCVDTQAVCQTMASIYPKEHFFSTLPGQTFWMEGNRLKKVDESAPFLRVAPPETWPVRGMTGTGEVPDYTPATGRRKLDAGEREAIERGLEELAGALVGAELFRGLCSLHSDDAPGRTLSFAFVLRDGEERLGYEYVPSACKFDRVEGDPRERLLAGIECWAADLLAVLNGSLGPIALTFGRSRLWNAASRRFNFDIFNALYEVSHPLRRPAAYLRSYEALWQSCRTVPPSVAHR